MLKDAVAANNMDTIKNASDDLQKAMYAVSEKLYKAAATQGQPVDPTQQAPGASANTGNVYDADFKDVDDNK